MVSGDDEDGEESSRQRVRQSLAPAPRPAAALSDASRRFLRITQARGRGTEHKKCEQQSKAFPTVAQVDGHAKNESRRRARSRDQLESQRGKREHQIDSHGQDDPSSQVRKIAVQGRALDHGRAEHEAAAEQRHGGVIVQTHRGAFDERAHDGGRRAHGQCFVDRQRGIHPARQDVRSPCAGQGEARKSRPCLLRIVRKRRTSQRFTRHARQPVTQRHDRPNARDDVHAVAIEQYEQQD